MTITTNNAGFLPAQEWQQEHKDMQLTEKQRRVYQFLESYFHKHKQSPTYEEIKTALGFKSLNAVYKHLKQLESKGYLKSRWGNKKRSLELLLLRTSAAKIPFLGYVAAGTPIEPIEVPESIDVPETLLSGENNFALRVTGDSMVDEGIRDGDILIINKQPIAENGQTVVALVKGEATVKKFYARNGHIELIPANEKMPPMVFKPDEVEIVGIVIGLIRSYRQKKL
ncbi:MAG TPA: transcriptional repressor LexA [Deltaproteobacteria bacterium]|nr:transcriptional repressor LexA [Deltaproteobacteria bacterium]